MNNRIKPRHAREDDRPLRKLDGLPPAAPPFSATDRFGLPKRITLLESDEAMADRIRRVEKLVEEVFTTTVTHLGEEGARLLFKKTSSRRAGKPEGSTSIERDHYLLREYDTRANSGCAPRNITSLVAEHAKEAQPGLFRTEISAITRQLRRLLAARKKEQADREADFQEWCDTYKARFGEEPPNSLLGGWIEPTLDK